jgi:two-component system, NtrC family, nitrogen regulation response regulator NtrX
MKKHTTILLTDDEPSIRRALREILEFEGYNIVEADSGETALDTVKDTHIDLMFLDVMMKGKDGLEVLETLKEWQVEFPVIMLSGHGNIDTAVHTTRLGAFDFLQKPPDLNRLLITVRNALDRNDLFRENRSMRRKISKVSEIIGESEVIDNIRQTIKRVAPTDARVMITGENGTGKELVAKWLHEYSKRAMKAFIEVNCAAIPSELLESELFGHEKGAFTGATSQRIGKFEEANGGTLLLDEIGDMSPAAQAKVLRVLQEKKITRVGSTKTIEVDVRVISATNKDLVEEINEGRFREDLFHRLNVIPIHVPPLRDRKEDVKVLANAFLKELAQKDIIFADKYFSDNALKKLTDLTWSGNVRELHNVVERLGILSSGPEISESLIDKLVLNKKSVSQNENVSDLLNESISFQDYKEVTEKLYLVHQLNKHDWNISATADTIGIQRSHLYNKMKKYEIER